jgi:hypothetical protein
VLVPDRVSVPLLILVNEPPTPEIMPLTVVGARCC